MKKVVYSGPYQGLYRSSRFKAFLESQKGFEEIPTGSIGGSKFAGHIPEQNVAVCHEVYRDETRVTLFGDERGIGEVERIIKTAAESALISSSPSTQHPFQPSYPAGFGMERVD